MNEISESELARFKKVYFNMPEAERKLVISIIDGRKVTWEEAYLEIKNKTHSGRLL